MQNYFSPFSTHSTFQETQDYLAMKFGVDRGTNNYSLCAQIDDDFSKPHLK